MKDFKFKINGKDYTASVEEQGDNQVQVTVNGTAYNVEIDHEASAAPTIRTVAAAPVASAAPTAVSATQAKITAPLPGNITKILVSVGQSVKKGDVVMIMEAMKMENNIVAETDGKVKAIGAQLGQAVNQGDVLVELEGAAVAAAPTPKPVAKPAPAPKKAAAPAVQPAAAPKPAASAGGKTISAPLPGTITNVNVKVGQTVKKGEVLVVLEAMKMANDIVSEWDGTVKNVLVQQGASVNVGDALIEIG